MHFLHRNEQKSSLEDIVRQIDIKDVTRFFLINKLIINRLIMN